MGTANQPDEYRKKTFNGTNLVEKKLSNREFIECQFISCNFHKATLHDNDFENCVFKQCDLSMSSLESTGFKDCIFIGCKILGVDFTRCNSFRFSFAFKDCFLDYSIFCGTKMKKTQFTNCSLKEANFSNTDLTLSSFDNCDLSDAVFSHSILIRVDFRTARGFVIDPAINKMKRARFSSLNLQGLLYKYDLEVDDSLMG